MLEVGGASERSGGTVRVSEGYCITALTMCRGRGDLDHDPIFALLIVLRITNHSCYSLRRTSNEPQYINRTDAHLPGLETRTETRTTTTDKTRNRNATHRTQSRTTPFPLASPSLAQSLPRNPATSLSSPHTLSSTGTNHLPRTSLYGNPLVGCVAWTNGDSGLVRKWGMCVRDVGMCVGGRSGRCVGCCWDIVGGCCIGVAGREMVVMRGIEFVMIWQRSRIGRRNARQMESQQLNIVGTSTVSALGLEADCQHGRWSPLKTGGTDSKRE